MNTKTETAFSRNYQTGIQALNAGQFEDAVTYLTAAQVTATPEDNDTEESLLAGFLATAQFGLTLPPEVAADFD